MLRRVFRHFGEMGFQHVVAVQVRHFAVAFQPNFEFRVWGQEIESRHMQLEFS